MKGRIYLCLAHMSGEEEKYIKEAFDTNWVVPLGPNVNAFEEDLKGFVLGCEGNAATGKTDLQAEVASRSKEVVALSSGTAGVHLALIGCGVGVGVEVMVQSFTFCASSNPIAYLGAKPVFVDSEKDTWNMDPELLDRAIEDRIAKTGRKPKAIVPVYLYGMPGKIEEIMAVSQKWGIPVVEDAAEGFGSMYKGQACGTFGRFGCLSFNGNKMITTSGGGALICPDAETKKEIMFFATQAREAYPYYEHERIGYNYRMSNICAGIGRGQMTVLEDHIAHHRHVQAMYEDLLKDVKGITVHSEPRDTDPVSGEKVYDSNYWLCTITLDPDLKIKGEEKAYEEKIEGAVGGAAGVMHGGGAVHTDSEPNRNVEALRLYLDAAGIESRPVWKPMHLQPVYKKGECRESLLAVSGKEIICREYENSAAYINGTSESIFKVGMCLPAGPMVSDEDVRYIADKIKESVK